MNDPKTPKTWAELLSELYADDWDDKLKRYRSSFAFRGMVDASWSMQTSLIRMGGSYRELEKHMLRNFRKYAHRDVVERDSFWHWLTIAQHHGLPTRLLDWTYSPFVALHFATDDLSRMNQDGIIWCVKIPEAHSFLPKAFRSALEAEGSYVFTVEMLSRFELPDPRVTLAGFTISASDFIPTHIRHLDDFDRMAKKPFALFMEPPSIDDRIVNQFALFSVISSASVLMDQWLTQYPTLYKRVLIPASLKWEVRDRLDQANITERVLFPGLDGLSKWLKRHYSPSA
ncbi:MAG TPA: FRG domain-containing protein [Candidatus Omnitrophota bacterium]|nr:FRG domain-containing protein [Candidatus Omnitrophota bacterium]HQO58793.1 FRG domain-containing protein [Candidatus Omnitrophota bacterium]HQP11368.1 FRG domain-containing protein [Candidatus Omnitrophota bacterium]